jgi:hypothetical protein
MNRSDRDRLAVLETELLKVAAAEERSLIRLRRAGFHFTGIGQARSFLTKTREVARMQAQHVEMLNEFTDRSTR